ncbi:MAG: hypothetical protein ACON4V_08350 [Parvibaculales bacterium]
MSMSSTGGRGLFAHADEINMPLFICIGLLGMVGVLVLYSVAGGDMSPWAWRHGVRVPIGGQLVPIGTDGYALMCDESDEGSPDQHQQNSFQKVRGSKCLRSARATDLEVDPRSIDQNAPSKKTSKSGV